MKVHELAEALDLEIADMLEELEGLDIKVADEFADLSDDQVVTIQEELGLFIEEPASESEAEAPSEPVAEEDISASTAKTDVTPAPDEKAVSPEPVVAEAKEDESAKEESSNLIIATGPLIVKDFAAQLGLRPNQLIAELMQLNIFASINATIEIKVAQKLAQKHGMVLEQEKKRKKKKKEEEPSVVEEVIEKEEPEPAADREDLQISRPPIVTFLGHVDHGKTSLLDHIRKSRVAAGEDGGITQHIGAYTVDYNDRRITFLDTPGHAAFTAMRARGANITDIAVLLIAADDGIMPQTREAIKHVQAANVSMIVAINKIDLPGANVERVKQQLQQEGLTPEDWGGELICCPVSAETGDGIDDLLEMILLQTEMLELKANPNRPAQGYVVEAQMEAGMGPTATLLVRTGTLSLGDAVVCGPYWGRVKALLSDSGIKVRTAGPSAAVKCLGLTNVPEAGAPFRVYPNDKEAREVAETRLEEKRQDTLAKPTRAVSLEELLAETKVGEKVDLAVVLKADTKGSVEAVEQSLMAIESDKIQLKVMLAGVGNISENDILLASASNALVVGFHVGMTGAVKSSAKSESVEVRFYSIIYELLDDVRATMTGLLQPVFAEKVIANAEVRQVFSLTKKRNVAGCLVRKGRVTSKCKARILRGKEVVYEGNVSSLKHFQSDVSEIREGQECGIGLDRFDKYAEGDLIECFIMERREQEL